VLSLSFGTNSLQPSSVDPLARAAELAWQAGIVVVASGGNDGKAVPTLADPAYSPVVLAVGSSDPMGTQVRTDDTIPAFATHGTALRPIDVVAPGTHVLSLRVPGSFIDTNASPANVGTRFVRGSGTSQSAAVVSGVVALLEQRFPGITPAQVKYLLVNGAYRLDTNVLFTGRGIVDAAMSTALGATRLAALVPPPPPPSNVKGTLEASRGDSHVLSNGVALTGERDIFGRSFDVTSMNAAEAAHTAWSGGTFNGTAWTGAGWSAGAWSATTWTLDDWTGSRWRTAGWDGALWDGSRWRAADWAGSRWRTGDWSAAGWSSVAWS
jgi:serine protease AprX